MSRRRSDVDAELQELYDQVPEIPDCDGRCWVSCGPLDMSLRERQRIRAAGVKITPGEEAAQAENFWCEALKDGRCTVYAIRPMICRIWGAVEDLPCPYGCVPEGGRLPAEKGNALVAQSLRAGGTHVTSFDGLPDDEFMAVVRSDFYQRLMAARSAAGRDGMRRRMDGVLPAAFRKTEGQDDGV